MRCALEAVGPAGDCNMGHALYHPTTPPKGEIKLKLKQVWET